MVHTIQTILKKAGRFSMLKNTRASCKTDYFLLHFFLSSLINQFQRLAVFVPALLKNQKNFIQTDPEKNTEISQEWISSAHDNIYT